MNLKQMVEVTRIRTRLPLPVVIKQCIVLLLVAHFLCEVPSILTELFPAWSIQKRDMFLCPWFHYSLKINWWMKYLSGDLFDIITYYCFAKVAKHYSVTLFLIIFVLLIYHIIDMFFFFWDFKTSHWIYLDLLWTAIVFIRRCIKPYKPETIATIKSLF